MSKVNADFLVGALEATLGKEIGYNKAKPLIDECKQAAREYQKELEAKKEKDGPAVGRLAGWMDQQEEGKQDGE